MLNKLGNRHLVIRKIAATAKAAQMKQALAWAMRVKAKPDMRLCKLSTKSVACYWHQQRHVYWATRLQRDD